MRNINVVPSGLNAQAVTSTNGYQTSAIDAQLIVSGSVAVIVTGTATGAIKLQASNDPCLASNQAGQFIPANWTDLPGATVSISGAGSFIIPKLDLSYRWLRVVYTNATNTGNVTAQFNGIGF